MAIILQPVRVTAAEGNVSYSVQEVLKDDVGRWRELALLCKVVSAMHLGNPVIQAARDVMDTRYYDLKIMRKDVDTVLSYFGGKCYSEVGHLILKRLDEATKGL